MFVATLVNNLRYLLNSQPFLDFFFLLPGQEVAQPSQILNSLLQLMLLLSPDLITAMLSTQAYISRPPRKQSRAQMSNCLIILHTYA